MATNLSAAGDSDAPRRETRPNVRSTMGSTKGTLTRVGWSCAGIARLGIAEIPKPASTMPNEVNTLKGLGAKLRNYVYRSDYARGRDSNRIYITYDIALW